MGRVENAVNSDLPNLLREMSIVLSGSTRPNERREDNLYRSRMERVLDISVCPDQPKEREVRCEIPCISLRKNLPLLIRPVKAALRAPSLRFFTGARVGNLTLFECRMNQNQTAPQS